MSGVIDPSIFGGDGDNTPELPTFLDRREQEQSHETTEAVAEGGDQVQADGSGDLADVAGQVDGEAQTSAYPTEMTEAGEQHTLINPDATVGHNEAPMDREEMAKEFWKDINSYGRDSGKGAAALPRLGLRCVRAAADGLISTDKPKDGSDSDAVRIYKRYAEQDSKHAEHTKGGMKANAAKLNALIGLGAMTTLDGVEVAERAVAIREAMEANELKPKALFAGLVDVARAQMDQDAPLTDEAITGALSKTEKDKSVEKEWEAIGKRIDKLVAGEGADGLKDQSEPALKIAELVHERVASFAIEADTEDKVAFCMERGMTRSQAVAFVAQR